MNIAIETSRANLDNKTGVEWYAYNLIEALKRVDNENYYFLYSDKELKGDLAKLPGNFETKILPWNFNGFWTQFKLAFNIKNKEKILFIPSGMIPPLNIFRRYKIITTIHDLCFLEHPEYYSKQELKMQKLSLTLATMFSKKIITVSEYTKEKIIKLSNIKENRITVTHLGYDKSIYKVIEDKEYLDKVKKKYNLPEKFVLYVGRIEEKKNLINQIKAFYRFNQKYPDYKFVIAGKKGYGYDGIKTEIFKNDLHKNIIELGWIQSKDIAGLFNLSTAFMFASSYEGFGMPIIESMRCGCPVITSSVTSMPEVAGDAAILVEPSNILGIYEALCNIVENKDGFTDKLIEAGFERSKKFGWEKCARETKKVFESLKKKGILDGFRK